MLTVTGLTVTYGAARAVEDVDLAVDAGTVSLLLGVNGAGKSTTLKAIAGVLRPDRGHIHLDGRPLDRLNSSEVLRKGLALVPEGRRVFAPLSVTENLRLGGYTRSRREAAETMEQVFDMFPILRERSGAPAGLLSGGEQQMLAFGRALMSHPRCVLLDEPSMGLAPSIVQIVMAHVRQMADEGLAVLMVEQNADVALGIADEVRYIDRGVITFKGTPVELAALTAIPENPEDSGEPAPTPAAESRTSERHKT